MSAASPRIEYDPELQCGLVRVEADIARGCVTPFLPPDECTDMSGAIAYARRVDPGVRIVRTFAGSRPDTNYVRVAGEWRAA